MDGRRKNISNVELENQLKQIRIEKEWEQKLIAACQIKLQKLNHLLPPEQKPKAKKKKSTHAHVQCCLPRPLSSSNLVLPVIVARKENKAEHKAIKKMTLDEALKLYEEGDPGYSKFIIKLCEENPEKLHSILNSPDGKQSILHHAAGLNDLKLVRFLVNKHANPNVVNEQEQTPLEFAKEKNKNNLDVSIVTELNKRAHFFPSPAKQQQAPSKCAPRVFNRDLKPCLTRF